uniref:Cysteine-rich motor neuron 1 protein (inferred by orthology to a human protein) n=1 Tax=Strongyloides venezuelensis TaxID=75913 RepID=A0A0K0FAQ3_STRVS
MTFHLTKSTLFLISYLILSSLSILSISGNYNKIWIPTKYGCPSTCPPLSSCSSTNHCTGTTLDECGCCRVCVGNLHDKCGPKLGICAQGLHCSLEDSTSIDMNIGICRETYPEKCLNVKCPIKFISECPEDSRLTIPQVIPGECCTPAPTCICEPSGCQKTVPTCKSGYERILVKSGNSSVPGECCDEFRCEEIRRDCRNVKCPEVFDMDAIDTCPEDSFRPPSYVREEGCCPFNPGCRCKELHCPIGSCPENETLIIDWKGDGTPGKCCDKFHCINETISNKKVTKKFDYLWHRVVECHYNGIIYKEGQKWYENSCQNCECKNGVVLCKKMDCDKPPSDCTWVGVLNDECCPVCLGCKTDDGQYYSKNETWKKDDCTTCTCGIDGKNYCQTTTCIKQCDNPKKVDGECCPVCDEPLIIAPPKICPEIKCSLRCPNGLIKDSWGCFICKCADSIHTSNFYNDFDILSTLITDTCEDFDGMVCDKTCAHGFVKNQSGCRVCKCSKCPELDQCYKHCLYGFELNSQGCPICKCNPKVIINKEESSIVKIPLNDTCQITFEDGSFETKDNGEWWTDNNCRNCFCHDGKELCSIISCPQRPSFCPESQWMKKGDDCCPSCFGQHSIETKHDLTVCYNPGTGRLYVDGETWYSTPCTVCTCRVGHVLCAAPKCPPITCENPILDDNDTCCMRCLKADEDISNNKTIKKQQKLIIVESNSIGYYGSEDGHNEFCVDDIRIAHLIGQKWRKDECTSCECKKGNKINCYKEICPSLNDCKGKSVLVKGKCCPMCSDIFSSEAICTYEKTAYKVNEEWEDGRCKTCKCMAGSKIVCTETACPECKNPIYVDGQCCPMCREDDKILQIGNLELKKSNTMLKILCIALVGAFIFIVILLVFFVALWRKKNTNIDKKCVTEVSEPLPVYQKHFRCESLDDPTTESLLSDDCGSSLPGRSSSNCSSERGPNYTDKMLLQASK